MIYVTWKDETVNVVYRSYHAFARLQVSLFFSGYKMEFSSGLGGGARGPSPDPVKDYLFRTSDTKEI